MVTFIAGFIVGGIAGLVAGYILGNKKAKAFIKETAANVKDRVK